MRVWHNSNRLRCPSITGLSDEKKVRQKLVDAANHIERLLRQSDPEGLSFILDWKKARSIGQESSAIHEDQRQPLRSD